MYVGIKMTYSSFNLQKKNIQNSKKSQPKEKRSMRFMKN